MPCVGGTYLLEDTFTFSIDRISFSKHRYLSTIHVLLQRRRGGLHHDDRLEAVSPFINTIHMFMQIVYKSNYVEIHLPKKYNLTAYTEMCYSAHTTACGKYK
jgi:hypothetical protein